MWSIQRQVGGATPRRRLTLTLTFETALAKAEAFERASSEGRSVIPVNAMAIHQGAKMKPDIPRKARQPTPANQSSSQCYRCGSRKHQANSSDCPAKEAVCRACSKKGHFQIVCRSSKHKVETRRDWKSVNQIISSSDCNREFRVFASNSILNACVMFL